MTTEQYYEICAEMDAKEERAYNLLTEIVEAPRRLTGIFRMNILSDSAIMLLRRTKKGFIKEVILSNYFWSGGRAPTMQRLTFDDAVELFAKFEDKFYKWTSNKEEITAIRNGYSYP